MAGAEITGRDVWQKLMGSGLPRIWVPKAEEIHIIQALPTLGTGKTDLGAIKRMAMAFNQDVEGAIA